MPCTALQLDQPVIFDANVNYYEIWGDYDIPHTRPTDEQRRAALELTELADHVVADSSYTIDVPAAAPRQRCAPPCDGRRWR